MTDEKNVAIVISSSARAMIEAMGMQAENKIREHRGEAMAYNEEAFDSIITANGIDWNSVMVLLNR